MEWLPIIFKFLDMFLAQCQNAVSSETPQAYVLAHYNAATGKLERGIVLDAMTQTYRAIRKARHELSPADRKDFPRYSRTEVYDITEHRLLDAMNATDDQVAAARAAAATLEDDN